MKIEHFRSFLAVAKHLSCREAACERHLTPPAISKQLRSLQQALHISLYKRKGAGIVLTDAGRMVLRRVEAIVKQVDELENGFPTTIQTVKQPTVLGLAATYSLFAEVLPTLIKRFEKSHPEAEIRCTTGSAQQVQQLVRQGRVELGLSSYRPLSADIGSEPFRVQSLDFFVHARHPLAARRQLTLADVLAYPLVIRSEHGGPAATHDILKEVSDQGYQYKVALRCSGPNMIKEMGAKNIGVGLSYLDNVKPDIRRGRFVVLRGSDFQFTTLSYIVYSKKRPLPAAAQEFLELLRRVTKLPSKKNLSEIDKPIKDRRDIANKDRRLLGFLPLLATALTGIAG